ncbi:MAG: peptidoglycan DD-metalloendopeptidase family protein [Polaromonas sp.]|nr:peptidoglycan DD-metalloendopeptidase family protein [Polaromonas sp.]
MTSAFGPRFNPITRNFSSEFHHGVDFGCPMNTPIVAVEGGVVAVSGFSNSAGNWVVVRSGGPEGMLAKYMHAERNLVAVGTVISKGDKVSLSGNTGRSTGPHLHFQYESGARQAVDPVPRFCSRPSASNSVIEGGVFPQSDVIDTGSQAAAPTNDAMAPAMGVDGSLNEVLADVVASRALNPDYVRQLSSLSEPRLYAELAYLKSIRLKVQHERSAHRERIVATQAMVQALMTESLKPQLDAQRRATTIQAAQQRP